MSTNSTLDTSVVLIDPSALQEFILKTATNATSVAAGAPPDLACMAFAINTDKGWNLHLHVRDFYYPRPTDLIAYTALILLVQIVLLVGMMNYQSFMRRQAPGL